MCSYATAMENKGMELGIAQGIQQGIEQGVEQEKIDALERVIRNYMNQDNALTREEAEEKARAILS